MKLILKIIITLKLCALPHATLLAKNQRVSMMNFEGGGDFRELRLSAVGPTVENVISQSPTRSLIDWWMLTASNWNTYHRHMQWCTWVLSIFEKCFKILLLLNFSTFFAKLHLCSQHFLCVESVWFEHEQLIKHFGMHYFLQYFNR